MSLKRPKVIHDDADGVDTVDAKKLKNNAPVEPNTTTSSDSDASSNGHPNGEEDTIVELNAQPWPAGCSGEEIITDMVTKDFFVAGNTAAINLSANLDTTLNTNLDTSEKGWSEVFVGYGLNVPPDIASKPFADVVSAILAKDKNKHEDLDLAILGCAYRPSLTVLPVLVSTPADLAGVFAPGGPGALAVAAAVTAAVNAAVPAAVNAALVPITSNFRHYNRNERAFLSVPALDAGFATLSPIRKEVAGAGPGLPGVAAAALPAGHPFGVGVPIPSPPFPATVAAFRALTLADISALSIIYNDTFGIVAADQLPQRLAKLERFVCGL